MSRLPRLKGRGLFGHLKGLAFELSELAVVMFF